MQPFTRQAIARVPALLDRGHHAHRITGRYSLEGYDLRQREQSTHRDLLSLDSSCSCQHLCKQANIYRESDSVVLCGLDGKVREYEALQVDLCVELCSSVYTGCAVQMENCRSDHDTTSGERKFMYRSTQWLAVQLSGRALGRNERNSTTGSSSLTKQPSVP